MYRRKNWRFCFSLGKAADGVILSVDQMTKKVITIACELFFCLTLWICQD